MKIVGLTGSIGSGKSTVAAIFKTLGVAVYNSDERARQLYFAPDIRQKVETLLGKKAYKNASTLDKGFIRSQIFGDPELLKKLNAIIHPAVGKDFENFLSLHRKDNYVIKETALLFEAGLEKKVDKIVLVTTNEELRNTRISLRDHISAKEIESIIKAQVPDKEKIKKADWVIENNEEKLLVPQVMKIHESLRS